MKITNNKVIVYILMPLLIMIMTFSDPFSMTVFATSTGSKTESKEKTEEEKAQEEQKKKEASALEQSIKEKESAIASAKNEKNALAKGKSDVEQIKSIKLLDIDAKKSYTFNSTAINTIIEKSLTFADVSYTTASLTTEDKSMIELLQLTSNSGM